jgi:hypothetical protein
MALFNISDLESDKRPVVRFIHFLLYLETWKSVVQQAVHSTHNFKKANYRKINGCSLFIRKLFLKLLIFPYPGMQSVEQC